MKNSEIKIRRAEHKDLLRIHTLADEANISHSELTERSSIGFLISNYRKDDYSLFIDTADLFFVAEDEAGNVQAFLFAYSNTNVVAKNDWVSSFLNSYIKREFIVIKQICVNYTFSSRGFAKALYKNLISVDTKNTFVTAIISDPPNSRSFDFHKKQGFKPFLEIQPETDDLWRTLLIKSQNYDSSLFRIRHIN